MSSGVSMTELHFSRPWRSITTMLIIMGLVGAASWLAIPTIGPIFFANIYLNGVILGVFVIGVFSCFWQVLSLISAVGWIEGFAERRAGFDHVRPPRLLTSLATLLKSRRGTMQISATSTQSILDSMATRLDEGREITRFITNLLIFLGLLGTFYGLATTVPAVVDTIRSLAPSDGEGGVEVFGRLMTGLEKQLGGMGTAFSSSLLGLAGSLVVSLLDLFTGQSQNRYYREIEEWLSTITRVGVSGQDGEPASMTTDAGMTDVAIIQMAESVDALQKTLISTEMTQGDTAGRIAQLTQAILEMNAQLANQGADVVSRADVEHQNQTLTQIAELNARIIELQDQQVTVDRASVLDQTRILSQIADGQDQLSSLMSSQAGLVKQQTEIMEKSAEEPDDWQARRRLESIDVQLLRILEEMSAGRQDSLVQIRADIASLKQAIQGLSRKGAVQHHQPPAAQRKA